MKSRLLEIKGAKVLSRKQLKKITGGSRGGGSGHSNNCMPNGWCNPNVLCPGETRRCSGGDDCPTNGGAGDCDGNQQ